jgi:hypothetical protein
MAAPADQIEVSGVAFVAIGMKTHGNCTPYAQWNHPPIAGRATRAIDPHQASRPSRRKWQAYHQ